MAIFNSYFDITRGYYLVQDFAGPSTVNVQLKSQGPGFEVSAVFSAQASPVTSQVEVLQLQKIVVATVELFNTSWISWGLNQFMDYDHSQYIKVKRYPLVI